MKFKLTISLALLSGIHAAFAQADSVAINVQNGGAPVITTNSTGTAASTLQLESTVYPATEDQTVSWSILSGTITTASIDAFGLLSLPAQTTGMLTVLSSSATTPAVYDTMQVLVYCRPPHTNPINWFVIDNINIAGTALNNSSTGLGNTGAYTLFPSSGNSTATLIAGSSYSIDATVTSSAAAFPPDPTMHTYSLSAWIDYNRNGLLESTEWFYIEDSASGSQVNHTFTIPATASQGFAMMRVRSRLQGSNNGAADACSNYFGSGQTEDYVIYLENAPLKIGLTSFTGMQTSSANRLAWSIASCEEGDYFEVEKSTDGANFNILATIKANKTTKQYSYSDFLPAGEKNYYRLNLKDADGQNSYSHVVTLYGAGPSSSKSLHIFPNPFTHFLTLEHSFEHEEPLSVTITDLQGAIVKSFPVTHSGETIDTRDLQPGIYFVRYVSEAHTGTIKLVKQ